MSSLAFTRRGAGDPLVLLHGIGSCRQVWDPVIPALAEHFDVIAVDLPGHGDSEPLPSEIEPSPAALAASLVEVLDDLGITTPHVAGNSLGGWVSLELAQLRPVASLTLLSPAGLWRNKTPMYARLSLRNIRRGTKHAGRVLSRLVRYRLGRILVLGQIHGRPSRVDPEYARTGIRAMGTSVGFDATFKATLALRYEPGLPIDAPVAVAFGSRDRILLRRQSRHVERLPAGTRIGSLPRCGHVPMPDDPDAVASLIISNATSRSGSAKSPGHLV
jgi:pimeloyl-ACP methyl ester carboxylesterase